MVNTKAYLAMVVGGFITMLIGGALFIFSYIVVDAIMGAAVSGGTIMGTNSTNNASFWSGVGTLQTGLQLASLVFVAVGFYMVVSVFIGIGSSTGGGRGGV